MRGRRERIEENRRGERKRERERRRKTRRRRTLDTSLENEEESAGKEQGESVLGRASLSGKLLIP